MQLEHAFTVDAPVETVWRSLLDPERVAPCMPGATLTGTDGSTFTGKVKVKLGPVSMQYKGTGEYVTTDDEHHTAVIEAQGKDAKGNGTASATVTLRLTADGARTSGTSETDLTVTGKPAQFGRGMIAEVGGKILEQFAANLGRTLAEGAPETSPETTAAPAAAPTAAADAAPAPEPTGEDVPAGAASTAPRPPAQETEARETEALETEALELSQYARGAVLKRTLPLIGAGAVAALIVMLVLRLRGRGPERRGG